MTDVQGTHDSFKIEAIGHIISPFKDKFGLPRQPGLIKSSNAKIRMRPEYSQREAFRGLEGFSHIWVSFVFDRNYGKQWKPSVRPPRLGGNRRVGVFASRSPFRPNNIGLSLVELHTINWKKNYCELTISCPDLVNGTPVVDLKPYLSYCDHVEHSRSAYAADKPTEQLTVKLDAKIKSTLENETQYQDLERLIVETISLDPRPAYRKDETEKRYFLRLHEFEIGFTVHNNNALVDTLTRIEDTGTKD